MTHAVIEWQRVKALFSETFEADLTTRRRLLDSESDQAVRRKVESMLSAHDSTDGPLDRSVLVAIDTIDVPALTLLGKRLGPYLVVREIGRGGMGAVYEGVRADSQFEQRVAIKTLRIGVDSSALLRRFGRERRILAGMQHPNIAALYDGAVTEDGLPYFVLELVDGIPIDAYCNERKASLRERIELFLQVISAVQYAHQQLVVHRDLKPSNILVTRDGTVKLVDFGIAKLIESDGDELTRDLAAPLTISYASPEQVRGAPITSASDVYSLGVVLYRLLTGTNPLDLDNVSLERAVTALSTSVPPPPSIAATAKAVTSMQLASLEKLQASLRGDLDAILMTALRKEPERRYATAREFGDDLQKYLNGLPVSAVRDSVSYRLRKFVRRQPAVVGASLIAAVAIIAGGTATLWQARAARIEAQRAVLVSRFLQSVIGAGDLTEASKSPRLGPSATVVDLLDSAASRLPRDLQNDPQARAEIHLALGSAFVTQERLSQARTQYQFALSLAETFPHQPRIETARALLGLATIQVLSGGKLPVEMATRTRDILDRLGAQSTVDYARTLHLSGLIAALNASYVRADSLLGQSLALYESLDRGPSGEKAGAVVDHAAVGEATGKPWTTALAEYRRARAMVDVVPGDVVEKSYVLWYAARAEGIAGNQALADSLGLEALKVLERATTPRSSGVAQQLAQLAEIKRGRGDTAASRKYIERAVSIIDSERDIPGLTRERVQMEYAKFMMAHGNLAAADSLAALVYRSRMAAGNWVYILDGDNLYTDVLMKEHKLDKAEPILREAYELSARESLAIYRSLFARRLVQVYYSLKKPQLAEPYLAALPDSVQRELRASPTLRSVDVTKKAPRPH